MTGAPGYVKGGRRDARDMAPDAARQAGSSFRRWLNSVIPEPHPDLAAAVAAPLDAAVSPPPSHAAAELSPERPAVSMAAEPAPAGSSARSAARSLPDRDLVALCNRFEGITRQLERLVRTTLDPAGRSDGAAPDDNDDDGPRADPDSPLARAVAEIAARQRALEGDGAPSVPSMFAPVLSPSALPGGPDLSRLEEQLRLITAQIETLRSPCRAEELAGELRQELRQIGRAVHDLVPRHAFEALEGEVRALAAKLDESRGAAFDPATLAPLEQGLAEVREALRGLAPGELAGSVNTLFHKIDQVSAEGLDPTVLHQLQGAVDTLRGIVAQVASGDALAALVAEVRALSDKIEREPAPPPVPAVPSSDVFANLERQISSIAETLAAQSAAQAAMSAAAPVSGEATAPAAPAVALPPTLEPLMASLAERLQKFDLMADERPSLGPIEAQISRLDDKLDRFQAERDDDAVLRPLQERITDIGDKLDRINTGGLDPAVVAQVEDRIRMLADKLDRIERSALDHPGLAPLEQRIGQLVQKIEQSESRLEMLPALERGMAELLAHVEALQTARPATPEASPAFAALARDVESIRQTQEDADRRTRESLDAAHGTLGRMADRLAAIETDLRDASRLAPPAPEAPLVPALSAAAAPASAVAPSSVPRGNGLAIPIGPPPRPVETLSPPIAPVGETGLPPDAPIEPGSGPPWQRGSRSAADRIAASQAALGPAGEPAAPSGARPNFILAARRAAQAASEQQGPAMPAPGLGDPEGSRGRKLTDRVKALFMTTSVIVIALALVPIGLRSFGPDSGRPVEIAAPAPKAEDTTASVAAAAGATTPAAAIGRGDAKLADLVPPADLAAAARALAAASPTAKALIERHLPKIKDETSLLAPPTPSAPDTVPAVPPSPPVTATPPAPSPARPAAPTGDLTGALPPGRAVAPATPLAAVAPPAIPQAPPPATPLASTPSFGVADAWPETLPPGLATKPLLAGVAAKSPAAAYEIAMRYAEGRGVPADLAAAVPWFLRAAELGLAPAQFRLGSLYEKGQGVKKDIGEARRWYQAAADRGNANAMHNIAVLYAEGFDGKPDFATAAQWFIKAARYGVADSQYNLAILYVRGIGLEQNLAEAYKWFAIAAQKGDKDAAKKRDDLAQRLDQQSLTAARLAAQTFVPLVAPEEAVTVPPPPGGWEDATAGQGRPKPKSRIPMEQAARL